MFRQSQPNTRGISTDEMIATSEIEESPVAQRYVPDLVALHATLRPRAVALAAGSELLSFAELEDRSNRLAHYLKSLGVGPNQLVGLCMERSPAMVMAALAILKAGGAYVPLDPASPAERLAFMLHDAAVSVLVTHHGFANKITGGNWRLVDLEEQAPKIAAQPSRNVPSLIEDASLAYVIYTSGSTGQPKGVEITHRGLANLVAWHCRAFQVTGEDRASHQAAVGFDAAVWETWPYLAAGASVRIPQEALRHDPKGLRDWLVTEGITITFLASPLAERMLRLEWPSHTALRILLTGADILHHRPAATVPFTLINNYGPTECTVVATSGPVAPGEVAGKLPSIGRPIDNTRIYILDEAMRPVAPGAAGELYVAGAGVARGYRNQPELSLQRFLPNPFSSISGDRLYRTGDRARCLANGEIEFLGRLDEQVKIRGFRVEPNEIVRALDQHPEVEASAVVATGNEGGESRLVAYVSLSSQATVRATGLRKHLLERLPDYMIPAAFVQMPSLPVTANGKLDRSNLPLPSAANMLREDEFVSPRGIVEERLAPIIASLLYVDRVGANDNFFLLGGHSLLGTQLITRISQVFGVDLPLLQLFDHPTLAEMACEIEALIVAKLGTQSIEDRNPSNESPA